MRILIVAPGTLVSTYDIYRYWTTALGRCRGVSEVITFPFHERIAHYQVTGQVPQSEALVAAALELPLAIQEQQPDVVIVVDGILLPQEVLSRLREPGHGRPITTLLFTEAPYFDDLALAMGVHFDLLFVHETRSIARLDEALPDTRVELLPHSYSRDVHRPGSGLSPDYDVYCCGTFFPERIALLRSVDWSEYRTAFPGQWFMASPADLQALGDLVDPKPRPNALVARDYRHSKLVLNIHRSSSTFVQNSSEGVQVRDLGPPPPADSVGPRPIEAAACGAFQLTDDRAGIRQIFGDCVPIFHGPDHLQALLAQYLGSPEQRERLAATARAKVQGMSYDDRASDLLDLIGEIEAQTEPSE